jgi:hypothetical protein
MQNRDIEQQKLTITRQDNEARATAVKAQLQATVTAARDELERASAARRDNLKQQYIPKILSDNPIERRQAIAVYQELEPSEATLMLKRLAALEIGPTSAPTPVLATPVPGPTSGSALPGPTATAVPATPTTSPLVEAVRNAEAVAAVTWSVVAGSDTDFQSALTEVNRARDEGFTALGVYLRDGYYATTVGAFPSEVEARSALIGVRAKVRDSAFVVNIASWCPRAEVVRTAAGTAYQFYECLPADTTPLFKGAACAVTQRTGAFQLWDGPGRPYNRISKLLQPGDRVDVLHWANSQDGVPWFRNHVAGEPPTAWLISYETAPDGSHLNMDCTFETEPPFARR